MAFLVALSDDFVVDQEVNGDVGIARASRSQLESQVNGLAGGNTPLESIDCCVGSQSSGVFIDVEVVESGESA